MTIPKSFDNYVLDEIPPQPVFFKSFWISQILFLLVLGSIFGLPNAVINSTEFLGSFGDSRQVFIDNLSIIIYTLVNTLFLLLLSSNLKFKESEMNSKLARYNLNKVNTPRVNKFHYSLCFSLIFMYLVFMIMPDEGFNLFSLLFCLQSSDCDFTSTTYV